MRFWKVRVGADRTTFSEWDFGVCAGDVFTDHFIAKDVSVVAYADLAGFGFPYVSVIIPSTFIGALRIVGIIFSLTFCC